MNTESSSTILSTLLNPTSLLHPLPISCVNLMIVQVKVKLVVIYNFKLFSKCTVYTNGYYLCIGKKYTRNNF